MKWKPIATAPKDGTPLLLWLSEAVDRTYEVDGLCDHVAIGYWIYGCWKSIEVEDCGTMGSEYTGYMPDWVPIDIKPSHWLPIPDAPDAA